MGKYIRRRTAHLLKKIDKQPYSLYVYENRHFRWLTFNKRNTQTAMSLADPSNTVLAYLAPLLEGMLFIDNPEKIILLGLGGGRLACHLLQYFPEAHLQAVEIDKDIVDIAHDYFQLPPPSERLTITIADAFEYIKAPHQADMLLVDLYLENRLPDEVHEPSFYEHCHQALSDRGLLACNMIFRDEQAFLQVLHHLRRLFDQQTLCVPVQGFTNMIIFAFKDPQYRKKVESYCRKRNGKLTLDTQIGLIC